MRTFLIIWSGQLVSLLGSSFTTFALGVWVYEQTGSVTQYALIALAGSAPGLILTPFIGVLVDRWNRRKTMLIADACAFISTLTMFFLLSIGKLEIWHIIILSVWSSCCGSFQSLAYSTSVTLLLPRQKYARATGLMQLAHSIGHISAPLVGGLLMAVIGLRGVIFLDMGSFLVAVLTLLLVRIPDVERKSEAKKNMKKEIGEAWVYLKKRREMLALMGYFSALNFGFGMAMTAALPMILALTDKTTAGVVLSMGGLGTLCGSLLMSSLGGPDRKIMGVFMFHALCAMGLLISAQPSIYSVGAGIFIFSMGMPLVGGCNQVIWLSKTDAEIQGRVFALRRVVGLGMMPISKLIIGPLSDHVFEPLMKPDGLVGQTAIGSFMGTGQGRGIALMIFIIGIISLITPLLISRLTIFRNLKIDSD